MNMLKCPKGHYTLSEKCHVCQAPAISPHPPKFSLEREQRIGKYRRMANEKA